MEILHTPVFSQYSKRSSDSLHLECKKLKLDTRLSQSVLRKSERAKPKKVRSESSDSDLHSQTQTDLHSEWLMPSTASSFDLDPVIVDSGAYTVKMGYSGDVRPKIIPNAIMKVKSEKKRLFIGDQIEDCRDLSGLYSLLPCERGYITRWEVQKPVWDYVFNKGAAIEERYIAMTQPLFNFKTLQDGIDELFFEDYEVKGMYRASPSDLSRYEYCNKVASTDECIVVDSGYSFTHVVPYIDGMKYYSGIQRVSVGGKFLTNYLRDIISYRMYDVMEETYVINQVKEDCSYISMDVVKELEKSMLPKDKNPISINYVLPDFHMIRRGYIQDMEVEDEIADSCQTLRLNNERFTVPELLFYPKDVGLTCVGVAEAVTRTIMKAPASSRRALSQNIVLTGGNVRIPGFQERLEADLRSLLPNGCPVKTYKPEDPVVFPWRGGKSIVHDPQFKQMLVTKQEYEEHGSKITYERFNAWASEPEDEPPKPTETLPNVNYMDNIKKHNPFGKQYSAPVAPAQERPIYVDDPGEGPSSRADPVFPVDDDPETYDLTDSPEQFRADDASVTSAGASVVEVAPSKRTGSAEGKSEDDAEAAAIRAEIEEMEYRWFMEDMMSYI